MRPQTHKSSCEHALRSADTYVSRMYSYVIYCIYAICTIL